MPIRMPDFDEMRRLADQLAPSCGKIQEFVDSMTGRTDLKRLGLLSADTVQHLTRSPILEHSEALAATYAHLSEVSGLPEVARQLQTMGIGRDLPQAMEAAQVALTPDIRAAFSSADELRAAADQIGSLNVGRALSVLAQEASFIGRLKYAFPEGGGDPDLWVEDDEAIDPEQAAEARHQIIRARLLPVRIVGAIRKRPEGMRELSSREFEKFVAELLHDMDFDEVILTPRTGDGGRDVVATKWVNDVPVIFSYECKRYAEHRKIGPHVLHALLGTVTRGPTKSNKGILVTTSSFTSGAQDLILTEPLLDGKDFDDLVNWLTCYRR